MSYCSSVFFLPLGWDRMAGGRVSLFSQPSKSPNLPSRLGSGQPVSPGHRLVKKKRMMWCISERFLFLSPCRSTGWFSPIFTVRAWLSSGKSFSWNCGLTFLLLFCYTLLWLQEDFLFQVRVLILFVMQWNLVHWRDKSQNTPWLIALDSVFPLVL